MKYVVVIKLSYCATEIPFDDINEACSFMSMIAEKIPSAEGDRLSVGMHVEFTEKEEQ